MLTTDHYNFILNRVSVVSKESSKRFGEETLTPIGYFGNLKHVLERLTLMTCLEADLSDIKSIIEAMERLSDEFVDAVSTANINVKSLDIKDN